MKKITKSLIITLILTILTFAQIYAQSNTREINILKSLYDKRDFETGYKLGRQFTVKNPDNLDLQYWYAINGARSSESKSTSDDIEKLVKTKGENIWTLLALAVVQIRQKADDSLVTANKIIKLTSDNEEAIFVYNSALFQNEKYQDSLNWLNKNEGKVKDKTRYLIAKASSSYFVEKEKKELGKVESAFDLFRQALKSAPQSVSANYMFGNYLTREKRFEDAIPFLRKSLEISPNGNNLREAYWTAIKSQTSKNNEQKNAEFESALSDYLKQKKYAPDAILAAWKGYVNLTIWHDTASAKHLAKRRWLKEIISKKYPNTKYDEEVAFTEPIYIYGKYFDKTENPKYLEIYNKPKSKRTIEEIRYFADYDARMKVFKAERIAAERTFLKRPQRFNKESFGQTAFSLLQSIYNEKESTEREISALAKDASENYKNYWGNINTEIALLLVAREEVSPSILNARDAENYARAGVAEALEKIKLLPKDASPTQIQVVQLKPQIILAQALINIKRMEEAEKLLITVAKTLATADSQNSNIEIAKRYEEEAWAKFYSENKIWDKAENYHVRIYKDNDMGRKAFEKLYEKRFGKKEGFEEYFAEIQKKLKAKVREKIIESRLKNAQDAIPFTLKDLNNKTISFADFKGKIIVINIWGVWCGPCVAEMNEIQELFDKYKADKDVAILTIDFNDELATVKKFITDRSLTIPVLLDDGYISKLPQFTQSAAYPTTLFIDKSGKVAFIKTGNSGNLVEEFSWRVEILK